MRLEKHVRVAETDEDYFKEVKNKIAHIIRAHFADCTRILSLFEVFEPFISSEFENRIKDFLSNPDGKRISDYDALVKELRYYQQLGEQIPHRVSFPLFEVNLLPVKEEILRTIA